MILFSIIWSITPSDPTTFYSELSSDNCRFITSPFCFTSRHLSISPSIFPTSGRSWLHSLGGLLYAEKDLLSAWNDSSQIVGLSQHYNDKSVIYF